MQISEQEVGDETLAQRQTGTLNSSVLESVSCSRRLCRREFGPRTQPERRTSSRSELCVSLFVRLLPLRLFVALCVLKLRLKSLRSVSQSHSVCGDSALRTKTWSRSSRPLVSLSSLPISVWRRLCLHWCSLLVSFFADEQMNLCCSQGLIFTACRCCLSVCPSEVLHLISWRSPSHRLNTLFFIYLIYL